MGSSNDSAYGPVRDLRQDTRHSAASQWRLCRSGRGRHLAGGSHRGRQELHPPTSFIVGASSDLMTLWQSCVTVCTDCFCFI